MSASMNRVTLIGNLGAAPELRYTQKGTAVCQMRMATNEKYTDGQGQQHEKVEWHSVVVWGKMGENCSKYLTKGSSVCVEGKLQTRKWDKEGQTHYSTEIVANQVLFLGGGSGGGGRRQENPDSEPAGGYEENVPF